MERLFVCPPACCNASDSAKCLNFMLLPVINTAIKTKTNMPQYQSSFPPLIPPCSVRKRVHALKWYHADCKFCALPSLQCKQVPISQCALPTVSLWIVSTIEKGCALQTARRPPPFVGMVTSAVSDQEAPVLWQEIHSLLG